MKQKLFTLFLALLTGAGMMFAETVASGTCGAEGDNLTWVLDDQGVLTISGTGAMKDWYNLGEAPFAEHFSSIQSVVIEDGVTRVGDIAFATCGMTSLSLGSSLKTIGYGSFYGCTGLTSLTIPDGVTSIEDLAFYGCSGLTSVTVPNSVTSIGDQTFLGCSAVTTPVYNDHIFFLMPASYEGAYTVPDGIERIANFAFYGCSGLTSVTLPNSVTRIGGYTFNGCTGLTAPIYNDHTFFLMLSSYEGAYTVPDGIERIANFAFYGCEGLTSVIIPDGVTSIGKQAFYYCIGLTSVTVPNSLTSVGESAFQNCSALTSPIYNDHIFFTMPTSYEGAYTVPDGIETIADGAFYTCTGLTSVTIPNSVTNIGIGAFITCSVNSPVYNSHVFAKMPANYEGAYVIPEGIETISSYAFQDCSKMTSVTIPKSVTRIDNNAFRFCKGLTSITCEATTPPICGDDCFYLVSKSVPVYVPEESIDAYVVAPEWIDFNNMRVIGAESDPYIIASGNCGAEGTNLHWKLTKDGLLTIAGMGEMAETSLPWYSYRSSIKSVVIDEGATSIGAFAFQGNSVMTSITIPSTVTRIGKGAFQVCNALTSISIPNSVTTIEESAFFNCGGLESIVIPNSVTSIGEMAFYNCPALTSVEISNSVKSIGKEAFRNCTALTSLTIPDGVTTIGESAFRRCSGMTSLTIGCRVTKIEQTAFASCTALKSITCRCAIPPSSFSNAFAEVSKSIPLIVPEGTWSAYHSKLPWKDFGNIQTTCMNISGTCGANGDNLIWEYTCDGYLTISGIGEMADWSSSSYVPWHFGESSIKCVIIKDGVTSIGAQAFASCKGLISVTIPKSVKKLNFGAFQICTALASITCNATTPPVCEDVCFNGVNKSIPVYVPKESVEAYQGESAKGWNEFTNIQGSCEPIASGTCGAEGDNITWELSCDGVLTISGTGAMMNWDSDTFDDIPWGTYRASIKMVEINEGVTAIGDNAFNSLWFAVSVKIPNSLTSIGESAFYWCENLPAVVFGNNLTRIGNNSFADCKSITAITIPASVTSIEAWAFRGCENLTSIVVESGNTKYDSRDECKAVIETATNTFIAGCKNSTIPNSVTTIGDWAFYEIPLTEITIPNSVTNIGGGAFQQCYSLASITCNAVTPPVCGYNCFNYVDKSIPVYVPEESESAYKAESAIGWKDFTNIQGVKCVIASGTCGADGDNLTWELGCDGVLTISGTGEMTDYWGDPFAPWYSYRSSVKSAVVEDGVTNIGAMALAGTSIQSVTIANSVVSIGEAAFEGCSDLTAVTIPGSVTEIHAYAFHYCTGLSLITSEALTPPACGNKCFEEVDKSIPVFVPKGTVDAYKDESATGWNEFFNIQEPFDPTGKIGYELVDLNKETLKEGQYLIVFDDNKAHAAVSGKDLIASSDVTIVGTTAYVPEESVCAVTIVPFDADSFSILLADETNYLDLQAKNSVTTSDAPAGFAITAGAQKTVEIAKYLASENKTYVLKHNGNFFRMYNSTLYTLPKLYRKKKETATAVENVQRDDVQCTKDKVQCTKVIENGVLYLMYNGTMYNVQGQVVK